MVYVLTIIELIHQRSLGQPIEQKSLGMEVPLDTHYLHSTICRW